MRSGLLRRFAGLAAAAGLALTAAIAAPKNPEPAIWTIAKPNGETITLFGSVHLLPDGQDWHTKALMDAYTNADVIVLETDLSVMQESSIQTYLAKHAMNDPGVTLSTLLTAEQKEIVTKAATAAGVSFGSMEGFRPWFAALQLSVAFALGQGFSPDQGVDQRIEADGKADGKAFDYFEAAREQLDLFIDIDEKDQIAFLVVGAQEIVEKPDELKRLVKAWAEGDVEAIDELMNAGYAEMPEIAEELLDARNGRWVKKILNFYMKDKNSYLIVVGAGHLAGSEGVPAKLREAGIEVDGP